MERINYVGGLFCDLQEAFDCVNHEILLEKMKLYGISGTANKLIELYLENRYQRISVNNINPYPTAFPYGNGMVLHFYQQQESSTTKTVHKVINKGLKTYV